MCLSLKNTEYLLTLSEVVSFILKEPSLNSPVVAVLPMSCNIFLFMFDHVKL